MVEILGIDIPFPDSFSLSPFTIILILSIFLFACAMIGGIFLYRHFLIYNRKIVFFDNLSGLGYQPVFKDRARVLKVGEGGEELLWLLKKKEYISAYGRKMGKNTYWFAKGQDGYDYNFLLGDLDTKLAMLDIEPIDRDLRLLSVAIRKNIEHRFKKVKFWDKHGVMVLGILALIVFLTGMWFIISKQVEVTSAINQGIQATKEVQEVTKQIISSLDNIYTGGSGIKPAT